MQVKTNANRRLQNLLRLRQAIKLKDDWSIHLAANAKKTVPLPSGFIDKRLKPQINYMLSGSQSDFVEGLDENCYEGTVRFWQRT